MNDVLSNIGESLLGNGALSSAFVGRLVDVQQAAGIHVVYHAKAARLSIVAHHLGIERDAMIERASIVRVGRIRSDTWSCSC